MGAGKRPGTHHAFGSAQQPTELQRALVFGARSFGGCLVGPLPENILPRRGSAEGLTPVSLLPDTWDCLPEAIGNVIARRCHWSPLGKSVSFTIDDSDDLRLTGKAFNGVVRAFDPATGMLLLHLVDRITYQGHYTADALDMIVTVPAIRWHRAPRLLITWTAVRVVDASSFALQDFGRTIGTGRLTLDRR